MDSLLDPEEPSRLFPGEVPSRTFTLELRKIGAQMGISTELLATMRAEVVEDMVCDQLMARVRAFVLSDQIVNRQFTSETLIPANPWQHLKLRFFPRWFKDRWPVRMSPITMTIKLDIGAIYPDAKVQIHDDRLGPVRFIEQAELLSWDAPDWAVKAKRPDLSYRQLLRETGRDERRYL